MYETSEGLSSEANSESQILDNSRSLQACKSCGVVDGFDVEVPQFLVNFTMADGSDEFAFDGAEVFFGGKFADHVFITGKACHVKHSFDVLF